MRVVLSIKGHSTSRTRKNGIEQVNGFNLDIRAGEIVGLAGVAATVRACRAINALVQRLLSAGTITVKGERWGTTPKGG